MNMNQNVGNCKYAFLYTKAFSDNKSLPGLQVVQRLASLLPFL